MKWLVSAMLAWPAAMTQAQGAESLCNGVEDFALNVLGMKEAGVQEADMRRSLDIKDAETLDRLLTHAYSDNRVTGEVMLAMARAECSMLALRVDPRFSPEVVTLDVDARLSPVEWVEECARQTWIFNNVKLRGRGTLFQEWSVRKAEATEAASFMWNQREVLNSMDNGPEDWVQDEQIERVTSFQSEIMTSLNTCVLQRLEIDAEAK